MRDLAEKIKLQILESMDLNVDHSDEEIHNIISATIRRETRDRIISLSDRKKLGNIIFNSLRKMDVLQELVEDDSVTEIMIDGPDRIFLEKDGRLFKSTMVFPGNDKLLDVIQQIVGEQNRIVNESSPIVDTRLSDGSRVNIVLPPIAIDGAAVTIRKFPKNPFTIEQLIEIDSLSKEISSFLETLVVAGYNIFISGGTGSGKTTFLNCLSNFIPKDERIITIEDSAELQIRGVDNLVRLESRNATMEGLLEISMRDLIKSALRMRPSRVIIGECRGAEALDMLQAMNTGHDGSLSTGHANSCKDILSRLETMTLMGSVELPLVAIRSQIASGIDIIVQLSRLRDRSRKVVEIVEVDGIKDGEIQLNPLYLFEEIGETDGRINGQWKRVGELKHTGKLQRAGLSV